MTVVRKVKTMGGTYHIHHDGRRVFVPATSLPSGPIRAFQPMWAPRQGNLPTETPNYAPPGQRLPVAGRPRHTPPAIAGAPPQTGGQSGDFAPDSAYYEMAAARLKQRNAAFASYDRQDAEDRTGTAETLRRINLQEPVAQQNTKEAYNARGLFHSSDYGREKARLSTQYIRQRADIQSSQRRREVARAEARRALEAGMSVEDAAALAAAADRQIERDTSAADNNALVPNVPAAPPPTPSAPAAPRVTSPARTPPRPRRPRAGRGTSSRRRRRPRNTPGRF